MNFVEEFKAGQKGLNMGWTTGIPALDKAMLGTQQKKTYGVVAAPKTGKTTFADFAFIISPYLQAIRENRLDEIEWVYFSYEIDRVSKEFKFASFFMAYDYGIYHFVHEGETYPMSPNYLQGKLFRTTGKDSSGNDIKELVPVSKDHSDKLKEIYTNRIVPLFGEYNSNGDKISTGKIVHFLEEQDNPTGMHKFLINYCRQHGTFTTERFMQDGVEKERIIGYKSHDPKVTRIIITDHVRKPTLERGFSMKQNIDKWLEYSTILRNRCRLTYVHIAHSNRGVANTERLKMAGEWIFPTSDDVKDSGNIAEECNVLMTLFNPNDEKYNLTKHFGVALSNFPFYRSLHITEARDVDCPVHVQMNMYGNINMFTPLVNGLSQ